MEGPSSSSATGLEIALVGTAISVEWCERSDACSSAGNRYQLGLIRGLESALGHALHVLSVRPVVMHPRSKTILDGGGTCRVGDLSVAKLVPFINRPVFKQFTILLSLVMQLSAWLWRERGASKRVVLVYNCFSPFSLAVLGATRLWGGTPVAIVADLPHDVYDFKGVVRGLLQRIDFHIQTHVIRRFTAIIPLTRQIAQDYAPERPALVVEGGIQADEVEQTNALGLQPASSQTTREKIILYSGALNAINGIDLLIRAFRLLPDPQYRLHVFGRGPMEPLLHEAAEQDKRILYGGVLPNSEIRRRQVQATVLVNPRPSDREITQYTFPSKLLEYIASGRPTVTTALPGIPEEYYPYVFLARDETPEGLASAIRGVCERDQIELTEFGERARQFVLGEKTWSRQGERIHDFLCGLK
jgi:glycosyltransferase involved in cell wall biosynthesis